LALFDPMAVAPPAMIHDLFFPQFALFFESLITRNFLGNI